MEDKCEAMACHPRDLLSKSHMRQIALDKMEQRVAEGGDMHHEFTKLMGKIKWKASIGEFSIAVQGTPTSVLQYLKFLGYNIVKYPHIPGLVVEWKL